MHRQINARRKEAATQRSRGDTCSSHREREGESRVTTQGGLFPVFPDGMTRLESETGKLCELKRGSGLGPSCESGENSAPGYGRAQHRLPLSVEPWLQSEACAP